MTASPATPPVSPSSSPPREGALMVAFAIGVAASVVVILPTGDLGYDRFAIPKELLLQLTAWLGALALVGRVRGPRAALDLCLLASCALGLVSVAAASNPWMGLRSWSMSAAAIVVFWVARHLSARDAAQDPSTADLVALDAVGRGRVLPAALWGTAVLCALTLLGEAHGVFPAISMEGRGPGGWAGNRNFAAHLLAAALPLALLVVAAARSARDRALAGLGLAAIVAAVTVARTRAAWVGGGTAVTLMIALLALGGGPGRRGLRAWAPWWAGAAALGVACALLPASAIRWSVPNPYQDTMRRLFDYETGTGRGRVEQYARAIEIVKTHPLFGAGPGNWAMAYAASAEGDAPDSNYERLSPKSVNRTPNGDLMGAAAERGLLGLLAGAAALGLLGLRFVRALLPPRRRDGDAAPGDDAAPAPPGDGTFALLGICTLTATVVTGLFDSVLLRPDTAITVAASLGLAAGGLATREVATRAPARPPLRALALAGVLVVGGVGVTQQLVRVASAFHLPSRNPDDLARALKLDPGNHVMAAIAAALYERGGRCTEARTYAAIAKRWSPVFPFVDRIEERCATRALPSPGR